MLTVKGAARAPEDLSITSMSLHDGQKGKIRMLTIYVLRRRATLWYSYWECWILDTRSWMLDINFCMYLRNPRPVSLLRGSVLKVRDV